MADSSAITFEKGFCSACGFPIEVMQVNGSPMMLDSLCKACVGLMEAISGNEYMRKAHWEWKRQQ